MKKKILLVEDDLFLGKLLKKKLELSDFEISYLKNGEEALALAKSEDFTAVVLDLVMPKKDGFKVLEELRGDEKTKDLPIVVASALNSDEDKERVKKLGANKYFVKSGSQLTEIIDYLKKL
jgi:two-component system, chemotaxis family, sensor kinase CheA